MGTTGIPSTRDAFSACGSSLCDASRKPSANAEMSFCPRSQSFASTSVESIPPLANTPTGTSATSCRFTAAVNSLSTSAVASSKEIRRSRGGGAPTKGRSIDASPETATLRSSETACPAASASAERRARRQRASPRLEHEEMAREQAVNILVKRPRRRHEMGREQAVDRLR
jgi:hypothetical protein